MSIDLLLGLIGDNIAKSRSPRLHGLAGAQHGLHVRYDRLVPKELGLGFEAVFEMARSQGYRGLNITYPYKERVVPLVTIDDPLVAAMGAVNTVLFTPSGPKGYNTDYSGFIAAYRDKRANALPGRSCLIGTGGVGRAIAFGLLALGARELALMDLIRPKAEALAQALRAAAPDVLVEVFDTAPEAIAGAAGLNNGTPVGMVGHDGTVFAPETIRAAEWVFDAVYTPVQTQFLQDSAAAGLTVITGEALFFWQGIHAWKLFSGRDLDQEALRAGLAVQD
jgi:shikimate dehydrogenase